MIKVNLQNILGLAVLGMTLLATPVPTWAGEVYLDEVFVSNFDAGGSMAGARYSLDNKQYIGCNLYAASNASPMVYCSARDSYARYYSCSSTDLEYVEQTQRMTASAFIYFKADSAGVCSQLHIHNLSSRLP